jgi:hypothetical protein
LTAVLWTCGTGAVLAQAGTDLPGGPASLYLSPQEPATVDPVWAAPAPIPEAPAADLSLKMDESSLMAADAGADAGAGAAPAAAAPAADAPAAGPAKKGPPLPLHTVEGSGGALFVPFAYIVNPGPPGTTATPPAASYTFVNIGGKMVQQFVATMALWRRIELGYSFGTLSLGDWPQDVQRHTGIDIGFKHVVLHCFSLRGVLIEEKENIPQVTAGVVFKYNPTVQELDRRLMHAARGLGLARSNGVDYVLTASKTIPKVVCGRPVILTGGLRFSQAAQLGYLGFGDAYRLTWEADVCVPVTDWFVMSYEYRQKKNPYRTFTTVVDNEDDWHAICLGFILSDRLTFACGWGHLGSVVNHHEDGMWGFQFKYEF